MSEWQPIETASEDDTPILRPHSIWGAMAVRRKKAIISGVEFEWVNSDYTTAWPEGAFLPYWMPCPDLPKEHK